MYLCACNIYISCRIACEPYSCTCIGSYFGIASLESHFTACKVYSAISCSYGECIVAVSDGLAAEEIKVAAVYSDSCIAHALIIAVDRTAVDSKLIG